MTETIIKLDDVSFSYEDTPILTDVSFQVKKGEFMGIFGPNGGGKTTLLRLILGFLKPSTGRIEIFGTSPLNAQKDIGYVPQRLRFDKEFPISVLELVLSGRLYNLPWYGRFSKEDTQVAMEMLEKVGLADFKNANFGNLSGGQAQRVLIARSLVSNPKLLLLDEPTASVDTQAESEIYKILEELKSKITILMVTHHLQTAIHQVERVLCVKQSVISLKPEQVCEHFAIGLYHPPLKGI
jgi:zinc transport system ATP-binding protein